MASTYLTRAATGSVTKAKKLTMWLMAKKGYI